MKPTVEPIPVAVVPPVGEDAPKEKCGKSTTRKKIPKGITQPLTDKHISPRPQRRPGESRWDDPTVGGGNTRSRGRSATRSCSTPHLSNSHIGKNLVQSQM